MDESWKDYWEQFRSAEEKELDALHLLHLDGDCDEDCPWCRADRDRAEESNGG